MNEITDTAVGATATASATVMTGMPFFAYLGGAFFVAHQPGMGFWDGVVWVWYVGRYNIAHNFTVLTY